MIQVSGNMSDLQPNSLFSVMRFNMHRKFFIHNLNLKYLLVDHICLRINGSGLTLLIIKKIKNWIRRAF